MTRIIAGEFGGRRIVVPDEGTRPTSDRVREAVFSAVVARADIDGARVLDLYAGSGALGIEARSRGAGHLTFVDSGKKAAGVIRKNLASLSVDGDVIAFPVVTFLERERPSGARRFDLVFLDPPYDIATTEIDAALDALAGGWLSDDALVVVERAARAVRSAPTTWPDAFEVLVAKNYGDTHVEIAGLS